MANEKTVLRSSLGHLIIGDDEKISMSSVEVIGVIRLYKNEIFCLLYCAIYCMEII